MGLQWKATCSRGRATLLKHGIGKHKVRMVVGGCTAYAHAGVHSMKKNILHAAFPFYTKGRKR